MLFNLINMYQLDDTLFDDIVIPEGVDHDTVVNCILDECGNYEPIWGDLGLLKGKIAFFFKKNEIAFQRVNIALSAEYSPIENYDRTESTTRNANGSNVNQQSAFDTEGFSNTGKNDSTSAETVTSRIHGNIGVTTAQQMIQAELGLRKYTIYEYIAERFMSDIMICVYD